MKNTTELREELTTVYKDYKAGKIEAKEVKHIVHLANAMLKSAAVESEYNKFLELKDEISFLKSNPKK